MTFQEADQLYPFDPAHKDRPEPFHGLEKLRAFEEDRMRRAVYYAQTTPADRKAGATPPGFVPWDKRTKGQNVPPPNPDEDERRFR